MFESLESKTRYKKETGYSMNKINKELIFNKVSEIIKGIGIYKGAELLNVSHELIRKIQQKNFPTVYLSQTSELTIFYRNFCEFFDLDVFDILTIGSQSKIINSQETHYSINIDNNELKRCLSSCMASALRPREERVIRLRYLKEKTLNEVGQIFNVTRERIRQVEAKALRKMKHPMRSKKLRELYYG